MPEGGNSNIEIAHHLSAHHASVTRKTGYWRQLGARIVHCSHRCHSHGLGAGYQGCTLEWTSKPRTVHSIAGKLRVQAEGATTNANQEAAFTTQHSNRRRVDQGQEAQDGNRSLPGPPLNGVFYLEFRPAFEAWKLKNRPAH